MKRSSIKPKTAAVKRAQAQRRKRLGKTKVARSAVSKGPARDPAHLAKVRAWGCLVCVSQRGSYGMPVEAHHVRCIGPRTLGKRVSDYLSVPLCPYHHVKLHAGDEQQYWESKQINPCDFIRSFSEEGRAALAALEESK